MAQDKPTGLMTGLMNHPDRAIIALRHPHFSWEVPTTQQGDFQTAYQILVATSRGKLSGNLADMWNTGKINSHQSINISYNGKSLLPHQTYYWQVRTWNKQGKPSAYSIPQEFKTADTLGQFQIPSEPVNITPVSPVNIVQKSAGKYFIDFGKDAFGWLRLEINASSSHTLIVRFGEKAINDSIDLHPGGNIRFADTTVTLIPGQHTYNIHTSANYKNTHGYAVPVPDDLGVLLPFRYVEIEGAPFDINASIIKQIRVTAPFDDEDSYFHSSDSILNAIWDLCKYSIKATSAFNIYVDGDRERRPYEADAYIDQLGSYCIDKSYTIARVTAQYLLQHPTWPTEWKFHSIFIAYADYMYTGNKDLLQHDYPILQSKLLQQYALPDGLLDTHTLQDNVDWPKGERDGFVMEPVNTVENAFYYRSLIEMAEIADAIGKTSDANRYQQQAEQLKNIFNQKLFNPQTGLYVDGIGTNHSSDHANFFPLAFGLVPSSREANIVKFLITKKMAPSVYGAQYLLTALYKAGAADEALHLLTDTTKRSWYNMIGVGSTITMEAWDRQFKGNLDWNHAWGAAPANIIPRYLMGVRPLSPGYAKVLIDPQPGTLPSAEGKFPTIRGPILVSFNHQVNQYFTLDCTIPANMTARVGIPDEGSDSDQLIVNGHSRKGMHQNNRIYIDVLSGHYIIQRSVNK